MQFKGKIFDNRMDLLDAIVNHYLNHHAESQEDAKQMLHDLDDHELAFLCADALSLEDGLQEGGMDDGDYNIDNLAYAFRLKRDTMASVGQPNSGADRNGHDAPVHQQQE